MRISDWSSDVCSSDLAGQLRRSVAFAVDRVLSPSRMTSMRTSLSIVLCGLASTPALAADLDLKLQIPQIDVVEYHRPYVAVWLERADRKSTRLNSSH